MAPGMHVRITVRSASILRVQRHAEGSQACSEEPEDIAICTIVVQRLFAASLVELGQLESIDWLAKVDQYACLPRVITDKCHYPLPQMLLNNARLKLHNCSVMVLSRFVPLWKGDQSHMTLPARAKPVATSGWSPTRVAALGQGVGVAESTTLQGAAADSLKYTFARPHTMIWPSPPRPHRLFAQ